MKRTQAVSLVALVMAVVALVAVLTDRLTDPAVNRMAAQPASPAGARGAGRAGSADAEPATEAAPAELLPPVAGSRVPAGEPLEASARSGGDAHVAPSSSELPTPAELREFKEYVAGTIAELRRDDAAERTRSLQARAAGLDARMPELVEALVLSREQSDKLQTALLVYFERETEYLRLWADGADEEILSELKVSDARQHWREVSGFLTPRQLDGYRDQLARIAARGGR